MPSSKGELELSKRSPAGFNALGWGSVDSAVKGEMSSVSYNGTPPSKEGILMMAPFSSVRGAEAATVSKPWGGMAFAVDTRLLEKARAVRNPPAIRPVMMICR